MGKFSLENKIKERLEGHEVHVDKHELWKALGIEEEEKDRKAIWFWWFAGLFGIVFIGGLWWFLQKDGLEITNIQDANRVEIEESISKTGNETLSETSTSDKLSAIIDDVNSKETKSNDQSSSNTKNSNQSKDYLNRNSSKENITTTIPTIVQEAAQPISESESEHAHSRHNNVSAKEPDVPSVLTQELNIFGLPYSTTTLTYNREIEAPEASVNPLIKPIAQTRKFEFELFGGLGTINRDLTSENQDLSNYLDGRDTSEAMLEHVSLGISLKYILGGGFYGKAGLSFNRWNESYSYNLVSDTIEESVEVPEVITFQLDGSSTTQFTEGIRTIYNSTDWKRFNRLTQIDLPITLGYEHRISRLSIFGEATAIVNLKQTFRGYLNTEEGLETKDPDIFKPRIGLNFGMNAGIGYGLTPRLRARLSARYYRSLGSVLLPSTEIDQKYSSVGIRMGIGYLF